MQWTARDFLRTLRRQVWNKRIKLAWDRLWIRKNEFHSSLSLDDEVLFVMNEKEQEEYHRDLERRRRIAHERSLMRFKS